MARASTYDAITFNASLLGGIIDFAAGHADSQIRPLSDGSPDPAFMATAGISAFIRGTTHDIKTALTRIGILGSASSGAGVFAYDRPFATGSTRTATGSLKYTLATCAQIPRRISARHRGLATFDFECLGYAADGTDPLDVTTSADALLSPTKDQAWTLGRVVLDSATTLANVQSIDIDLGITAMEISGDGSPYATSIAIVSRMPVIRVSMMDATIMDTLAGGGYAASQVTLYLRRLVAGANVDANTNATHIKFDVNVAGISNARTSGGQIIENAFDIFPYVAGGTALIVATADTAITLP